MAPKTESQSLAITDLTKEPVHKKQERRTQEGAARVVAIEAGASAVSSGRGTRSRSPSSSHGSDAKTASDETSKTPERCAASCSTLTSRQASGAQ